MSSSYAFVTLLSSDSYLPGALVLAASLRDVHPYPPVEPEVAFKTICLVTPESVDVQSIKALRKAFDVVVGVEILEGDNAQGLHLLGTYYLAPVSIYALYSVFGLAKQAEARSRGTLARFQCRREFLRTALLTPSRLSHYIPRGSCYITAQGPGLCLMRPLTETKSSYMRSSARPQCSTVYYMIHARGC